MRSGSITFIIVNDGSTDNTQREALKFRKRNVMVVGYSKNAGKGNAILCGMAHASGNYVIFLDSDLEIGPAYAFDLLSTAAASGAGVAILSKNHPLSSTNFPAYRKFLSRGYYMFAKILFRIPVSDTQTGCKVFRADVLGQVAGFLAAKRFCFDLELLAYVNMLGHAIIEKPIDVVFRREKSRIRTSSVLEMFADTILIFFRYHRNAGRVRKASGFNNLAKT